MQQSEKLVLGAGFLSIVLGAAGVFGVASDLRWRNALVLTCHGNDRYPKKKKRKNITYLNAFAEACHSRPISTRIRTHLYMSSVPPWYSTPSWRVSPSLSSNGRESAEVAESRSALRKVAELRLLPLIQNLAAISHQTPAWARETSF